MRIEHIQSHLKHLVDQGMKEPQDVFKTVTTLYLKERIDDIDVEAGGDRLEFRWGTRDTGDGKYFQVELARRTLPQQPQETATQLRAIFSYESDEVTAGIGEGSRNCHHPEKLPQFEESILNDECITAIRSLCPQSITISVD